MSLMYESIYGYLFRFDWFSLEKAINSFDWKIDFCTAVDVIRVEAII